MEPRVLPPSFRQLRHNIICWKVIHVLLLAVAILPAARGLKCNVQSGSSCICHMDDGSGSIDLSAVSSKDKPFFSGIKNGGSTYSFNPCSQFTDKSCKNAIVCQDDRTCCGRPTEVSFDVSKQPPLVTYGKGDVLGKAARISIVVLKCDPKQDHTLTMDGENPRGTYHFTLTSKYSCVVKPPPPPPTTQAPPPPVDTTPAPRPQPTAAPTVYHHKEDSQVSVGTILDISMLMVLITYLVAGTSFMYFRRGERGKDALPNIAFWMALPGLIKEGSLFLVVKVRSLRGGSSAGYDAL